LLQDLLHIATEATEIIQYQRTSETLKRAQESVNIPNLRDIDTTERCLGSLIGISTNFREVSFVGMEDIGYLSKEHGTHSPEDGSTETSTLQPSSPTLLGAGVGTGTSVVSAGLQQKKYKVHVLQKKTPQMRVITRGLKKNARQVVEEYLYHRELLQLGIDPARLGQNGKKTKNVFETKEDQKEMIRQKLQTRLTILSDAEVNSSGNAPAQPNALVDWIVIEVKLPSYFHWTAKPSCSRFFLSVLKARNPNHDGNQGEMNSIQAISEILAKALTASSFSLDACLLLTDNSYLDLK
jgi:hypothetical protein